MKKETTEACLSTRAYLKHSLALYHVPEAIQFVSAIDFRQVAKATIENLLSYLQNPANSTGRG